MAAAGEHSRDPSRSEQSDGAGNWQTAWSNIRIEREEERQRQERRRQRRATQDEEIRTALATEIPPSAAARAGARLLNPVRQIAHTIKRVVGSSDGASLPPSYSDQDVVMPSGIDGAVEDDNAQPVGSESTIAADVARTSHEEYMAMAEQFRAWPADVQDRITRTHQQSQAAARRAEQAQAFADGGAANRADSISEDARRASATGKDDRQGLPRILHKMNKSFNSLGRRKR